MMPWQLFFWANVALILYVYLGYPALLWILDQFKVKRPLLIKEDFEPTVSLIIAAYNEELVIAQKIENCLNFYYPRDKMEIIIVSDGSNDNTVNIAHRYETQGVSVLKLPENVGKSSAQNEAVKQATGDILIFTDAEAFLQVDTIRKLVRHFYHKNTGCVVGKVVYLNEEETGVSKGEGLYWRYELFIRKKESEIGILTMGSGSIMAVRQELFEPLDPDVSEDFVLPIRAAMQGSRTVFDPQSTASLKLFQDQPLDMFRTKVRTILLDTRSLFLFREILNPFRFPLFSWGLVSHKLLRWLVPYFLIILFFLNFFLLNYPLYVLILTTQITFYTLAIIAYFLQSRSKMCRILNIPFSFCLVNLASLVGVACFAIGKKAGKWIPVR